MKTRSGCRVRWHHLTETELSKSQPQASSAISEALAPGGLRVTRGLFCWGRLKVSERASWRGSWVQAHLCPGGVAALERRPSPTKTLGGGPRIQSSPSVCRPHALMSLNLSHEKHRAQGSQHVCGWNENRRVWAFPCPFFALTFSNLIWVLCQH